MVDMLVKKVINGHAALVGRIANGQQIANFVQGHVERPVIPNELKSLQMQGAVQTVVVARSGWHWEQALSFVEPDCFNLSVSLLGELANA